VLRLRDLLHRRPRNPDRGEVERLLGDLDQVRDQRAVLDYALGAYGSPFELRLLLRRARVGAGG
jgi:hypothetical protein